MAKVIGLDRLNRKLAALPAAAQKRIREAMEASAKEIVAMMRALVPTDSGALRDSINWTWGNAPKGALTLAKVSQVGSGENVLTIYAGDKDAYYARWVEFGTAPHNVAKGGGTVKGRKQLSAGGGTGHPGSKAQPFFFVSYRALRKKAKGRVSRAITKAAKEVAAGGG